MAAPVETSSLQSVSGGGLWIAIKIRDELLNQYVQCLAYDDDVDGGGAAGFELTGASSIGGWIGHSVAVCLGYSVQWTASLNLSSICVP